MSGSSSASYYGDNHAYEVNDYLARVDGSRRAWDHSSVMNGDGSPLFLQEGSTGVDGTLLDIAIVQFLSICTDVYLVLMVWQDGIDPDNMTYEELLDLGEVVGNHNRGLSPECISSLPVSKYKCGFFLRRKSRCERCVICQMNYKRGDRQMILPCKHAFHASCVTRWLSINKRSSSNIVNCIDIFVSSFRHAPFATSRPQWLLSSGLHDVGVSPASPFTGKLFDKDNHQFSPSGFLQRRMKLVDQRKNNGRYM
ncbi:hypothetical protein ACLOJK_016035 [Asimina triloba]